MISPDWVKEISPDGWLQVIVSLVAVGVAILIPYWQRRNELAERRKELELGKARERAAARSVALQVMPVITKFIGDGRDWLLAFDRETSAWNKMHTILSFGDLTRQLGQSADKLHLLAGASEAMQNLVHRSHIYSIRVNEMSTSHHLNPTAVTEAMAAEVRSEAERIHGLAAQAQQELHELFWM